MAATRETERRLPMEANEGNPSLGFNFAGDGARTMMFVYSLPATEAIYQRFIGIDGSAQEVLMRLGKYQ
jgi:hypothetical protein